MDIVKSLTSSPVVQTLFPFCSSSLEPDFSSYSYYYDIMCCQENRQEIPSSLLGIQDGTSLQWDFIFCSILMKIFCFSQQYLATLWTLLATTFQKPVFPNFLGLYASYILPALHL